jgi:protein phosphatase
VYWESCSITDPGLVRPNNEDAVLVRPEARLFAVADGMGGHAAGEIASGLAIEVLDRGAGEMPADPTAVEDWLRKSFAAANAVIRAHGKSVAETHGMGTTLTALAAPISRDGVVVAHIGDSRAYRLHNRALEQLTRDHTWVQERVDAGLLTPSLARDHPFSSVLTRVLGMDTTVAPDLLNVDAQTGDLFLLCSDGLSTMLTDAEIASILASDGSLQDMASALVNTAKSNGGLDNITLVLLRRT